MMFGSYGVVLSRKSDTNRIFTTGKIQPMQHYHPQPVTDAIGVSLEKDVPITISVTVDAGDYSSSMSMDYMSDKQQTPYILPLMVKSDSIVTLPMDLL